MALTEKLTAIGDAIRVQSGKTDKLTLDQMPTEIIDLQSLGFEVVGGTTAPTNPKENTIWVNTDVEITSWVFDATQPEQAVEGMVWFDISISSTAPFNALKKNNITVYPMSASQYVGGAWVEKITKSYQNGAWVQWIPEGTLYLYGNQCTAASGGWKFVRGTSSSDWGTGTGVHNTDSMDLIVPESMYSIQATTIKKVDLSKYSKLCCETSGAAGYLQYDSTTTMDEGIARKAISKSTTKRTTTLDISSVGTSYYIAIQYSVLTGAGGTMKIYRVWLE